MAQATAQALVQALALVLDQALALALALAAIGAIHAKMLKIRKPAGKKRRPSGLQRSVAMKLMIKMLALMHGSKRTTDPSMTTKKKTWLKSKRSVAPTMTKNAGLIV